MKKRMLQLIETLNKASSLYYNTGDSFLTDKEFDKMLKELQDLEKQLGIVYSNSPTQKVGAEVLEGITKVKLDIPMLSLAKVHTQQEIVDFAKNKKVIGMIKADGLSVRLCYIDGCLAQASTRGNGIIGSDITEHISYFTNVPLIINQTGKYIIDGEAIIKLNDFKEINQDGEFKNPRNLAAGTLNLLDMSVVKKRKLSFVAWDVISGDNSNSLVEQLCHAEELGFEVIYHSSIHDNNFILEMAQQLNIPCDGVVWKFDDKAYGQSLGRTAHHFNCGIAWKPVDASEQTRLTGIEWSLGRTGVITPVALFEPVELEGTEVSRASLHNLTIMEDILGTPYIGQELEIIKANQIIPQVQEAVKKDWLTDTTSIVDISIPVICPICGGPLSRVKEVDSEVLFCGNDECPGKLVNRIVHFCSKKGLDIKGLSKATIEKLVDWGWVNDLVDLYHLSDHKNEWVAKPGFGEKSVSNILSAIEASRVVKLESFIAAIGIPQIGNSLTKEICKYVETYADFRNKVENNWNFTIIDGIAIEKQYAILNFDYKEADRVASEMESWTTTTIDEPSESPLSGLTIVVTGRLNRFSNRDAFINLILNNGGKVVSSVSRNTSILINNDIESNSSKNRTAKELGIPILTEEKFLAEYLLM